MMKLIKLIPTIIKNLILIIIYELKKLWRGSKKARWIMSLIAFVLVAGLGYRIWNYYHFDPNSQELTLSQAAKVGQMTTHKLMVELVGSTAPGQYERGDIIFIQPVNYQFTEEEKSKFLILKMNLTEKQAELMTNSLKKYVGHKDPNGQRVIESLKRRKCAVHLWRLGIWGNLQKGRELDKVFKWNVVYEK